MKKILIVIAVLVAMAAGPVVAERFYHKVYGEQVLVSSDIQIQFPWTRVWRYDIGINADATASGDITVVLYASGTGDSTIMVLRASRHSGFIHRFYGPPVDSIRIIAGANTSANVIAWK